MKPWKTIILTEDRTSDATANTYQWREFLGINSVEDFSSYYYVAVFSGNTQPTYNVNMIWFTGTSDSYNPSVRANWYNAGLGNRSLFAKAGTRIDVYKIPNYDG